MRSVPFLVLSGAGLAVVLVGLWLLRPYWRRRPGRAAALARVPEPRPHLEVLDTAERLHDAVERAALFERAVAARANDRAARYESMLSTRPSMAQYDVVRTLPRSQGDGPRSQGEDGPRPAA
jgi:hypothetical protein